MFQRQEQELQKLRGKAQSLENWVAEVEQRSQEAADEHRRTLNMAEERPQAQKEKLAELRDEYAKAQRPTSRLQLGRGLHALASVRGWTPWRE